MVSSKEINRRFKAKIGVNKRFLVCEECGGYYELEKGESINDFESCQCGGKLKQVVRKLQIEEQNTSKDEIIEKPNKIMQNRNALEKVEKFCVNCGSEIQKNAKYCQNCGFNLQDAVKRVEIDKEKKITEKGLTAGETLVICILPLAVGGLIAWLIWHNDKPKKANQACVISIIFFVIWLFIIILLISSYQSTTYVREPYYYYY